jgi:hypothetical protein
MESGTHRRNLLWKLNVLCDRDLALLNRALHINIGDLFAEICLGIDEPDQSIFDL